MAVLSRSLGKMFTTTKTVSEYEEVLEDDEYYEEIIIDDDGEEYYEEIIIDSPKGKKSGWQATQEQVDSMSLQNAKMYLLGLPNATGPTSVPTLDDDDYEYEEIEMPEVITPIRRSRRSSLFDAPKLDTLDEGNEQSEHSNASVLHSPGSTAGKRHGIRATLANIQESPTKITPLPLHDQRQTTTEVANATVVKTPKEETKDTSDVSPPGQSTNTTPSLSLKSIQSENTATTANMSGSNSSLDLGQVFGDGTLPLSSPASTPPSGTSRKKSGSSSNLLLTSPKEGISESPSSLHSSGHDSERRRRRSSASKGDDDDDSRSVKSKSGRSRRRSSESSKSREESVEAEIKQLVGKEPSRPKKSLGDILSSPRPSSRGDSDNKSTMSSRSSKSRRRSSGASVSRSSSRSVKTKPSTESTKTPSNTASTLSDFLNMMPAEPKKRSDARSTISASRRRARTRTTESSDRDCQSVAGLDLAAKNLKRSRSARRTKPKEEKEGSSRTRRARSTSVGRKERLRRSRVKEATDKANAQHQAEKVDLPKDDVPEIPKSRSSSSDDRGDRVESKRHGSPKERLPSSDKSKGEKETSEKRDVLKKRESYARGSRGSSSSLQKHDEGQGRSSIEKPKSDKEVTEKREELRKRESFARGSRGSSSSLQKHDEGQVRSSSEKPKSDKEVSEKREESRKRESFARGSRGSSSSLQKHGEDHDSYTSLTKTPTSSKEGRRPPMSRSGSGSDRGHGSHSAGLHKTPTSTEGRRPSVSRSGSGGERRRLKSGDDRVQATPKRSSMKKEGGKYTFQLPFNDESEGGFDGHMSFSRTLDLARSLHADSSHDHDHHDRQSAGEGSLSSFVHDTEAELNQLLSPGQEKHAGEEFNGNMSFSRTLELARSLHGASPRPGPSDTDESERSHRSIRRPSRSKSGDSTDSGELLSPRRKSYESRSLGKHHDAPVTPRTPRVPSRTTLKKNHSSDDVLLVDTDEDSCDHPGTPQDRGHVRPPRRSQSGRSPRDLVSTTSSSSKVYHSPRELRRSASSKSFLSPSKQHGSHSSSSAFSFQSPVQRTHSGSVESGSVSPLSTTKSTAFERMKELEEIKSFLTAEEYEEKRREILASI